MYPIEILLDEHKLVERVFAIVNKISEKLKDNKEIPATAFWKLVEFIRGYADVIHHSKEEDILFSQMQEHDEDLSTEVKDQIGVLIDEHIQGLDIANEMHKGIREYRRGHPAARNRFENCGGGAAERRNDSEGRDVLKNKGRCGANGKEGIHRALGRRDRA